MQLRPSLADYLTQLEFMAKYMNFHERKNFKLFGVCHQSEPIPNQEIGFLLYKEMAITFAIFSAVFLKFTGPILNASSREVNSGIILKAAVIPSS